MLVFEYDDEAQCLITDIVGLFVFLGVVEAARIFGVQGAEFALPVVELSGNLSEGIAFRRVTKGFSRVEGRWGGDGRGFVAQLGRNIGRHVDGEGGSWGDVRSRLFFGR